MEEKLKEILNHYGEEAQANQLVQELGELIVAITKGDVENAMEEVADVEIMLEQFKSFEAIDRDKIEEIKEYKIDRQLKRIEREKVNR
ncbi:hypothetical protein K5V21_06205 [Clostridium sardiniense]|uniref:Uncharacterized protein n=1 Tax=Clostridium sardiniense TaxID=29369 RepID=A0ABS7KW59_CLOSR|nr:hypothetical protein [Clostridium sardiniense]MBY0755046.1 hypothetical protein [Clostridium sardiniense]MDQ0459099.1 uncharacterized protein (DUF433 family) [Clostridium sardiniense]